MTTINFTNDFANELAALRPSLIKYAHLQLRNTEWAEDVVSETIIAALQKPQAFEGKAQLKTWLVGILKHKVLDVFRAQSKTASIFESSSDDGDEQSQADAIDKLLFNSNSHYVSPPSFWGDPEAAYTQKTFLDVLDACVNKLPASQGRALMMRDWLELTTQEICKELAVTETNINVLLCRARSRLNECLNLNWFSSAKAAK